MRQGARVAALGVGVWLALGVGAAGAVEPEARAAAYVVGGLEALATRLDGAGADCERVAETVALWVMAHRATMPLWAARLEEGAHAPGGEARVALRERLEGVAAAFERSVGRCEGSAAAREAMGALGRMMARAQAIPRAARDAAHRPRAQLGPACEALAYATDVDAEGSLCWAHRDAPEIAASCVPMHSSARAGLERVREAMEVISSDDLDASCARGLWRLIEHAARARAARRRGEARQGGEAP